MPAQGFGRRFGTFWHLLIGRDKASKSLSQGFSRTSWALSARVHVMVWESRPLAKRIVLAAAVAAAIAGGVAAWIAVPPRIEPDKIEAGVAIDPALIERGRYLAEVGDCVACHTAKGGTPMAGGLALETPFGTVWSTNITPDPTTGIGSWSYGAF